MGENELELVLKVLSRAISRETVAFNYYFKQSRNTSLPRGVRGLLTRLSEEERNHRKLIINEYMAVRKGYHEGDEASSGGGGVSYRIPEDPELVPLQKPARLDVKAVSLPARLVGGDNVLSRVIQEGPGRDVGLFITLYDAMGHSIETTEVNAAAASILGEYIDSNSSAGAQKEKLSPSRAVRYLNAELGGGLADQGVFITLFAAYIDLEEGRAIYTIAGQEPPIMVRGDGKVDSLLHTQLILGIDPEFKYREYEIPFSEGDALCVFSDGLVEARNPEDEYYGRRRLAEVLAKSGGKSAEKIIGDILSDIDRFSSGVPVEDEISILLACCLKGT